MSKAIVIDGVVVFPRNRNSAGANGKDSLNLMFDKKDSIDIEKQIMAQVASLKDKDFYLSLAHPPVKCGLAMAEKAESRKKKKLQLLGSYSEGDEKTFDDFKELDYIILRSSTNPTFEWLIVDDEGMRLSFDDLNFWDKVSVVLSVNVSTNDHGNQIYLNVKLIKVTEKSDRVSSASAISTEEALAAVNLNVIKEAIGELTIDAGDNNIAETDDDLLQF